MTAGRPSTYDPAYCDLVTTLGDSGASLAEMAYECGVCRNTLKNWRETHPEFLTALTRAELASQVWWERQGRVGMLADKFNGSVWSRSMAARFPDDWREVSRKELTGQDGGPVLTAVESRRVIIDPEHRNPA